MRVVVLITQRSRVQIPPPLPRPEALFRTEKGPSACSDLHGDERTADYRLRQGVGHLAVGLQVGLDVLLHGERYVRVTDPLAEGLPVDLRIAVSGGVAVAYVVQVDLGRPAAAASFLNRHVIVSGCGGLPSSRRTARRDPGSPSRRQAPDQEL
jgi:hypothetical protein